MSWRLMWRMTLAMHSGTASVHPPPLTPSPTLTLVVRREKCFDLWRTQRRIRLGANVDQRSLTEDGSADVKIVFEKHRWHGIESDQFESMKNVNEWRQFSLINRAESKERGNSTKSRHQFEDVDKVDHQWIEGSDETNDSDEKVHFYDDENDWSMNRKQWNPSIHIWRHRGLPWMSHSFFSTSTFISVDSSHDEDDGGEKEEDLHQSKRYREDLIDSDDRLININREGQWTSQNQFCCADGRDLSLLLWSLLN